MKAEEILHHIEAYSLGLKGRMSDMESKDKILEARVVTHEQKTDALWNGQASNLGLISKLEERVDKLEKQMEQRMSQFAGLNSRVVSLEEQDVLARIKVLENAVAMLAMPPEPKPPTETTT